MDFPIKNCVFSIVMLVYQRVKHASISAIVSSLSLFRTPGHPHQHFPIRLDVCGLKHHDHPAKKPRIHGFWDSRGVSKKMTCEFWMVSVTSMCHIYVYLPTYLPTYLILSYPILSYPILSYPIYPSTLSIHPFIYLFLSFFL